MRTANLTVCMSGNAINRVLLMYSHGTDLVKPNSLAIWNLCLITLAIIIIPYSEQVSPLLVTLTQSSRISNQVKTDVSRLTYCKDLTGLHKHLDCGFKDFTPLYYVILYSLDVS
ncbi:hypothetical protein AVEN_272211-1 [Araneus ventricosus]|uniref:Uncharacterized protein n=1 Tax=Araneus ventricosus TaxID=182803 RepID=A0A4Y2SFP7_ARAVE|nr:hypothetical protein AVEN_272211-1 [Araneus ventricosus]